MADRKSKKIICTSFDKGKKHDFRLYKESKTGIHITKKILVDTGYQVIHKLHTNKDIPKKKAKKQPLSEDDKKENRKISSQRVLVENIIREVKIFRVVAEKYRNRRKRFGLRINIIAALNNRSLDLNLKK